MMTVQVFLVVFHFSWLIVDAHSLPLKSIKSKDKGGGATNAAINFASDQGAATSGFTAVPYSIQSDPSILLQAPGFTQPVLQTSQGYMLAPVVYQAPGVAQLVQSGPVSGSFSSAVPVGGYSVGYVPVQAGYDDDAIQPEDTRTDTPETEWVIEPTLFEDVSDAEVLDPSDFLPASPSPPAGPILQSGETSNVLREAELGNYQQQTEEFGYPTESEVPEQGFTSSFVPSFDVGIFQGFPYPNFDFRLLYGLYPPGTYSTFSQTNEKGKDYMQDIHYLKEHITDYHDDEGQTKFFGDPQST
ncbi:uncharacterized protein ACNS7B_012417 [Menidia menidia]